MKQPQPDPVGGPAYEREGFVIEWVPEAPTYSSNWRLATEEEQATKTCRRPGCDRPAAAALHRRHVQTLNRKKDTPVWRWWFYCDWHLYGRRIRDGQLERRAYVATNKEEAG